MSYAYGLCEKAAAETILCIEAGGIKTVKAINAEAIKCSEDIEGLKEMEKMYRKKSLEAAAAISKTFEKQQIKSKVAFKREKSLEMANMVKMMSKLGGFQF